MIRQIVRWILYPQVRIAGRKRKLEKQLRAAGASKAEAIRIASERYQRESR